MSETPSFSGGSSFQARCECTESVEMAKTRVLRFEKALSSRLSISSSDGQVKLKSSG